MVQLYAFANLQPAISPYLYTRILLTIKKKMKQQRLVALDVLRGMTIAGMILVNTPGSWEHVWTPLRHAEWNGLTPTDMVFPSFMFMMGMAMYISLRKFNFTLNAALLRKILKRTVLLFLVGTALNIFANCLYALSYSEDGNTGQVLLEALGRTRTLGVLQRLALCYGIGSVLVSTVRHRLIPYIITGLLAAYYLLLLWGNGFVQGPENILSVVDRQLIGLTHMYNDHQIDPEGILSTVPAVAHVLVGFCFGRICIENKQMEQRLNKIFIAASLCLLAGLLLQYGCPINKKIWSPTFVLTTCGFAATTLALLIWHIDARGNRRGTHVWNVIGVNPLFCYVLSNLLSVLADTVPFGGNNLHHRVYHAMASIVGDGCFCSFLYALLIVALTWCIGNILYRKKIYIKL